MKENTKASESSPSGIANKQPSISLKKKNSAHVDTRNDIIVQLNIQKADRHIVRPSYLVRQKSVSAKASRVMDSLKDQAVRAVRNVKGGTTTVNMEPNTEPLIISAIEQKISSNKKSALENVIIEKKWVQGKKSVEVPIKYEQVFVNNQEIQRSALEETLVQVRDAILKIVPIDYPKKGEKDDSLWVPLFGPDTDMDKTIPLYAEQLVISKKIVKVGDIVIRKRQVTETEKIETGSIREEVIIENNANEL